MGGGGNWEQKEASQWELGITVKASRPILPVPHSILPSVVHTIAKHYLHIGAVSQSSGSVSGGWQYQREMRST